MSNCQEQHAEFCSQLYELSKVGKWAEFVYELESDTLLARVFARYTKPSSGWTSLHQAAYWNNMSACKVLVKHGASVDKADKEGKTPVDVAFEKGFLELGDFLQSVKLDGCWTPSADPTLVASSSKFSQHTRKVAVTDFVVAYGGGRISIYRGNSFYIDECGRVLVGWHGTFDPPCGMDGESMLTDASLAL